jgi:predicted nucleic acid-binding protein
MVLDPDAARAFAVQHGLDGCSSGYRAWELRDNLTVYDAWYVALAESLTAPPGA